MKKLYVQKRESYGEGQSFGNSGEYERIVGRIQFAVDPNAPEHQGIVDLDKAPKNGEGLVEFTSDLCILKPLDLSRGNRCLFVEFVNRGNKRALQFFNDAPHTNDPKTVVDAGNGFLMRRGYTVVWFGWEGDVLPGESRMTLDVPVASDEGKPITGLVRSEFITDQPGVYSFPLSGYVSARSYPAVSKDTDKATFTRRQYAMGKRIPIFPDEWKFARLEQEMGFPFASKEWAVVPSDSHVYLPEGFMCGWIYELLYMAKNPLVLGLGYVVARELVSFLRWDSSDSEGTPNPLRHGTVGMEKAYCWGRSQTGRLVREYIYRGFNCDSKGRRIFDGAFSHVAGAGRMWLNHRFAQPLRMGGFEHEDSFYHCDQFPFSYTQSTDHLTGKVDAILKRPKTDPLVIHTQTSSEYWSRRGSLVHTDTKGHDLPQPDNVRVYLWASSQHFADPLVERDIRGSSQRLNDIVATSPLFRVLLDHLDRWATDGTPPPPSRIPSRTDGTLVDIDEWREEFPPIPGVTVPREPNRLPLYDWEPEARECYYNTVLPTRELLGKGEYTVLIPKVDRDGNEVPGIRMPVVQAPRGTHTGWNTRIRGFGTGALSAVHGSYIPFPETREERELTNDPRLSLEERYPTEEEYLRVLGEAVQKLMADGFLLEEDANRIIKLAKEKRNL
jgi:hypothetical protein